MSMESAGKFFKKYFEDDNFLRELYKRGGLKTRKEATDEEARQNTVKVAKELGYDFSVEEYAPAMKKYFKEIGPWNTIKRLFHLGSFIRKIEKENKK